MYCGQCDIEFISGRYQEHKGNAKVEGAEEVAHVIRHSCVHRIDVFAESIENTTQRRRVKVRHGRAHQAVQHAVVQRTPSLDNTGGYST